MPPPYRDGPAYSGFMVWRDLSDNLWAGNFFWVCSRRCLPGRHFFLCGKAMIALARLDDRASIPVIEHIIEKSGNSRIIIHDALALELFKHLPSITILIKKVYMFPRGISPVIPDEDEIIIDNN